MPLGVAQSLPDDVTQGLARLSEGLRQAAPDNLRSLILYGGAARGRYHPGRSDVDVLVLLADASPPSLRAIAPALDEAWRTIRADPFVLTEAEFPDAARSFPTKFIEIRNHHAVLYGPDPLAGLRVSRRDALVRIEQELRNIQMRLRRRYLTVHGSPELLLLALEQLVVPLAVALDAMLEIHGRDSAPGNARREVLDQASRSFGLDAAALDGLAALRAGEPPPLDAAALVARVMATVGRAAGRAAEMAREAP